MPLFIARPLHLNQQPAADERPLQTVSAPIDGVEVRSRSWCGKRLWRPLGICDRRPNLRGRAVVRRNYKVIVGDSSNISAVGAVPGKRRAGASRRPGVGIAGAVTLAERVVMPTGYRKGLGDLNRTGLNVARAGRILRLEQVGKSGRQCTHQLKILRWITVPVGKV